MKKFIFSAFTILFISTQSLIAAGYIASYSMKVSDPSAYVEAMDELMDSDWGKSFPAPVSLHSYAFNGYDDATHVVVLNYEDAESLGKGTESFSDPTFQSFLEKISSISEDVEQSLNMKLVSGGSADPENNGVFTIYRMEVKDPETYAKLYKRVVRAQTQAGNVIGQYGLRQQVGGSVNYYSHYAFTSAGSVEQAIKSNEALLSSDSFAIFSEAVKENRKIKNVSMLINVKNWNTE